MPETSGASKARSEVGLALAVVLVIALIVVPLPATLLDLLGAADALRRPERLDVLLAACAADACSRPGAAQTYPPKQTVMAALEAVRSVDAGAIARAVMARRDTNGADDAIAKAVRSARLKALRQRRRA